jgi:hypothetical protein
VEKFTSITPGFVSPVQQARVCPPFSTQLQSDARLPCFPDHSYILATFLIFLSTPGLCFSTQNHADPTSTHGKSNSKWIRDQK